MERRENLQKSPLPTQNQPIPHLIQALFLHPFATTPCISLLTRFSHIITHTSSLLRNFLKNVRYNPFSPLTKSTTKSTTKSPLLKGAITMWMNEAAVSNQKRTYNYPPPPEIAGNFVLVQGKILPVVCYYHVFLGVILYQLKPLVVYM